MAEPARAPRMALSSWCRAEAHRTCASNGAVCACPCHPRPVTKEDLRVPVPNQAAPSQSKLTVAPTPLEPKAALREVIERVKADPPNPSNGPGRVSLAELIRPLLEDMLAEGDRDWNRLILFSSLKRAAMNLTHIKKVHGTTKWEWKSARLVDTGQSAIYVRLKPENKAEAQAS